MLGVTKCSIQLTTRRSVARVQTQNSQLIQKQNYIIPRSQRSGLSRARAPARARRNQKLGRNKCQLLNFVGLQLGNERPRRENRALNYASAYSSSVSHTKPRQNPLKSQARTYTLAYLRRQRWIKWPQGKMAEESKSSQSVGVSSVTRILHPAPIMTTVEVIKRVS